MSVLQSNDIAIQPYTPSADHTAARGKLVILATTIATLLASATVLPHGIVLDGQDPTNNANAQDSIGILGGNLGIVKLKAGGAVTKFHLLQTRADATVEDDDEAGARVIVGFSLEAAAADELFDAVVFRPRVIAAVALGNVNGAIAALNSTAVNPTKSDFDALLAATETLADDVRAIFAALQTAGILA